MTAALELHFQDLLIVLDHIDNSHYYSPPLHISVIGVAHSSSQKNNEVMIIFAYSIAFLLRELRIANISICDAATVPKMDFISRTSKSRAATVT
jgi:hypothetical protein